jgi:putative heme transporter
MIRGRLRRRKGAEVTSEETVLEIDPQELVGVFSAPAWLRDLGFTSWLLVGVAAALVGAVWLLAVTQTIVIPVVVGAIIAAVSSPIVDRLAARGVPRAAGAGLVLLGIVALGAGVVLVVIGGISSEGDGVTAALEDATDELAGWLDDAGASSEQADRAQQDVSAATTDGFHALIDGIAAGVDALASLVLFLTFTILATFYLLKDGPRLRDITARHLGVPETVGHTILSRTAGSLQSYFLGMTIVSAFSAAVVGVGALALDVDLVGTIVAVTFLGGYVPYLGAWLAGAFAVLIALGSSGPEAALAMAVIVLLANGALQQLVQPIAYGATLGLHPLVVLVVTIAGGSLFGAIGLILAAPLVAAAVKIADDLARARAQAERDATETEGAATGSEAASSPA